MPKPKAQPIEQEEEIEEVIQQQKPNLTQPVSNQILKQPSHNEGSFWTQSKTPNSKPCRFSKSLSVITKSVFTTEKGKV